jgi:hypothetical protein
MKNFHRSPPSPRCRREALVVELYQSSGSMRRAAAAGRSVRPYAVLRHEIVGNPPSLIETASGCMMMGHYVVSRVGEFRDLPGSELPPFQSRRTELGACDQPTVFLVRNTPEAGMLAAQSPRIASGGAGGRFVAYAPCGSRPAKAPR